MNKNDRIRTIHEFERHFGVEITGHEIKEDRLIYVDVDKKDKGAFDESTTGRSLFETLAFIVWGETDGDMEKSLYNEYAENGIKVYFDDDDTLRYEWECYTIYEDRIEK